MFPCAAMKRFDSLQVAGHDYVDCRVRLMARTLMSDDLSVVLLEAAAKVESWESLLVKILGAERPAEGD